MASQIRGLSPAKRALLELKLQPPREDVSHGSGISRRPNGETAPLSFAQERLWFLAQLQPGTSTYNRPAHIRLTGRLDVAALERALGEIVRRHEALRTIFADIEGRAAQVVTPFSTWTLPVVDLRALTEAERAAESERLARAEAQRPFDLGQGPLLRSSLLRLDEQRHVLLLTAHHIVFDEWSNGVLIRELTVLYEAFSTGRPSPLAELPVQYADFAHWQKQWLQGEVLETHLVYWRKQLAGAPEQLELPADRPRPPVRSFHGACQSFVLPKALSESLKALSRDAGATLFMTLLAVFKVLLYRYTGQEDIVVGTPIANRRRAEAESLIGFFVNTLVLRTDFSGDPSFLELLGRVRTVALEAYAHQDLPFEKLVEVLRPERDLSHTPLFQVMFVFENAPAGDRAPVGVRLNPWEVDLGTAKFDLTLSMRETSEGLIGSFEYSTDLFDAATVTRLCGHFRTLLEGAAAEPGRRLSTLPLLSEAERRQLFVEWNATATPYPTATLAALFEAQAARSPDAVAVVCHGDHLSYRALNRRANQLARYLRRLGVGPEVPVGLGLIRTPELIIALLGVLKAGGVYVPLDPTYPPQRLAFMLDDAQVRVLLTQAAEGIRLGSAELAASRQVVYMDTERAAWAGAPAGNLSDGATAENLAYIIYTSGSTGQPKGVALTHRNAVAFLQWAHRFFASETMAGVLAATSLSFDLSVFELLAPLISGGSVWLATDLLELATWPTAHGVTCLNTVPSGMAGLLDLGGVPASVRTVNLAGEPLSHELAQRIYEQTAVEEVFNLYGPSEDTTYSTVARIERGAGGPPPIGRPLANEQVYLLDGCGQPVPVGVPGELYLSGAGLARGYWRRPELTAERFLPSAFGDDPGKRLYRTGDLARYRPDGQLMFLGRLDHQVKLRGFRIEMGEIEAVLRRFPTVRETAVLMREAAPGDQRLVAYVVAEGPAASTATLREFLRERLPEYMVPATFVPLERLPRTTSGKLDRRALPIPSPKPLESVGACAAPQTPVEELMVGLWSEIFGGQSVGRQDHFFELGGHSLLATRLLSRVRKVFRVELPLRALFEAPTVAGLAERVERARQDQPEAEAPPLRPVTRDRPLPLSFAQQRLWFLNQLEPDSPWYNSPSAVRLTGKLDVPALDRTFSELVRRHEILRTTFPATDGHPVQVVGPAEPWRLPIVDLSGLPAAERTARSTQLTAAEARRSFALARGPLLRTVLLRLSADEHVLLLTMHHIVFDGWSAGVLLQELSALYAAFAQGHPSPLTELPVQYADFAAWQRQWLTGAVLERQRTYWHHQLTGPLPVLELPADHPRPAVRRFGGARLPLVLSPALTARLRALSRRAGGTLFMTLLAAFQALLYRYTGQTDLLVGAPIANRTHAELEGMIGCFVNTLVLRTDLSGDPPFCELLDRVREVSLAAYAHQDLPFEQLVEDLAPARDPNHTPLFQVMFILQNAPKEAPVVPGLQLDILPVDSGTTKFDLTLALAETKQGIVGTLAYSTDLFEAATAERLRDHFLTLLEGAAADPSGRLSALPLLSETERRQMLVQWNATETPYPTACVHQLFEAHAAQSPDAVALVFEGAHVSYGMLNRRANQLAHYLRRLGVGPEVAVGVGLERSLALIEALLAVLKAGGAYVPLDLTYPPERLAFMLADAQVSVLLTQASGISRFGAAAAAEGRRVIYMDREETVWAGAPTGDLSDGATAENLAYLIYTSGSTGQPKGALNTHGGLSNRLLWMQAQYDLRAADRVLQKTPCSFDVSAWEFFWPLLAGAGLVLARPGGHTDSGYLRRLIVQEQVTTLHFVPSLLQLFLQEPELTACRSLRRVFCSGEALPADLPGRFFAVFAAELHNLYGPTEAAIDVTAWACPRTAAPANVPIGRPIANLRIYVLDRHGQPTPVGVPGHLHIGGVGLARGYWQRPEQTAAAFRPDPFSGQEGQRLYATGDGARYLPDGALEFWGRLDGQVKLRGCRIELGEVEAVLRQHAAVAEAAVIVREDPPVGPRLVAYLVGQPGPTPSAGEWRRYLQQHLPEYMIPAAFVTLDRLPLTPSGKLDRHALPPPGRGAMGGTECVAPRHPIEAELVVLWQELLSVDAIGVYDNFFELGGHSLLLTRLAARIGQTFGVELSLRRLFDAPTIADITLAIAERQIEQEDPVEIAKLLDDLRQLSPEELRACLEAEKPLVGNVQ